MNELWEDIKLGSPITQFGRHYFDNYVVVGLAHNWAVLREEDGSIHHFVLEPADDFIIGQHFDTGGGNLKLNRIE